MSTDWMLDIGLLPTSPLSGMEMPSGIEEFNIVFNPTMFDAYQNLMEVGEIPFNVGASDFFFDVDTPAGEFFQGTNFAMSDAEQRINEVTNNLMMLLGKSPEEAKSIAGLPSKTDDYPTNLMSAAEQAAFSLLTTKQIIDDTINSVTEYAIGSLGKIEDIPTMTITEDKVDFSTFGNIQIDAINFSHDAAMKALENIENRTTSEIINRFIDYGDYNSLAELLSKESDFNAITKSNAILNMSDNTNGAITNLLEKIPVTEYLLPLDIKIPEGIPKTAEYTSGKYQLDINLPSNLGFEKTITYKSDDWGKITDISDKWKDYYYENEPLTLKGERLGPASRVITETILPSLQGAGYTKQTAYDVWGATSERHQTIDVAKWASDNQITAEQLDLMGLIGITKVPVETISSAVTNYNKNIAALPIQQVGKEETEIGLTISNNMLITPNLLPSVMGKLNVQESELSKWIFDKTTSYGSGPEQFIRSFNGGTAVAVDPSKNYETGDGKQFTGQFLLDNPNALSEAELIRLRESGIDLNLVERFDMGYASSVAHALSNENIAVPRTTLGNIVSTLEGVPVLGSIASAAIGLFYDSEHAAHASGLADVVNYKTVDESKGWIPVIPEIQATLFLTGLLQGEDPQYALQNTLQMGKETRVPVLELNAAGREVVDNTATALAVPGTTHFDLGSYKAMDSNSLFQLVFNHGTDEQIQNIVEKNPYAIATAAADPVTMFNIPARIEPTTIAEINSNVPVSPIENQLIGLNLIKETTSLLVGGKGTGTYGNDFLPVLLTFVNFVPGEQVESLAAKMLDKGADATKLTVSGIRDFVDMSIKIPSGSLPDSWSDAVTGGLAATLNKNPISAVNMVISGNTGDLAKVIDVGSIGNIDKADQAVADATIKWTHELEASAGNLVDNVDTIRNLVTEYNVNPLQIEKAFAEIKTTAPNYWKGITSNEVLEASGVDKAVIKQLDTQSDYLIQQTSDLIKNEIVNAPDPIKAAANMIDTIGFGSASHFAATIPVPDEMSVKFVEAIQEAVKNPAPAVTETLGTQTLPKTTMPGVSLPTISNEDLAKFWTQRKDLFESELYSIKAPDTMADLAVKADIAPTTSMYVGDILAPNIKPGDIIADTLSENKFVVDSIGEKNSIKVKLASNDDVVYKMLSTGKPYDYKLEASPIVSSDLFSQRPESIAIVGPKTVRGLEPGSVVIERNYGIPLVVTGVETRPIMINGIAAEEKTGKIFVAEATDAEFNAAVALRREILQGTTPTGATWDPAKALQQLIEQENAAEITNLEDIVKSTKHPGYTSTYTPPKSPITELVEQSKLTASTEMKVDIINAEQIKAGDILKDEKTGTLTTVISSNQKDTLLLQPTKQETINLISQGIEKPKIFVGDINPSVLDELKAPKPKATITVLTDQTPLTGVNFNTILRDVDTGEFVKMTSFKRTETGAELVVEVPSDAEKVFASRGNYVNIKVEVPATSIKRAPSSLPTTTGFRGPTIGEDIRFAEFETAYRNELNKEDWNTIQKIVDTHSATPDEATRITKILNNINPHASDDFASVFDSPLNILLEPAGTTGRTLIAEGKPIIPTAVIGTTKTTPSALETAINALNEGRIIDATNILSKVKDPSTFSLIREFIPDLALKTRVTDIMKLKTYGLTDNIVDGMIDLRSAGARDEMIKWGESGKSAANKMITGDEFTKDEFEVMLRPENMQTTFDAAKTSAGGRNPGVEAIENVRTRFRSGTITSDQGLKEIEDLQTILADCEKYVC